MTMPYTEQILNNFPYYDDYDPEKGYTKMLALPGRTEQSREFTQIQTMFFDFLKRLGDAVMKDGSILEGCDINISGTTITINTGKIYLGGLVRILEESSLEISGIGEETIGVIMQTVIVTEDDDESLNDPAQSYDNYGQPGCHRVKQVVQIVANNPQAITLYKLINGELSQVSSKPELSVVSDMLARRTYDEAGNHKVYGLDVVDKHYSTANTITVGVEPGKCYIKGYETVKPLATLVEVRKALDSRTVLGEIKTYYTGTISYKLNNHPVADITRMTAILEVTQTISRGNTTGGLDILPLSPVVDIVSVTQGGTTYVKGTDYQLSNDGVDWSLGGAEPAKGSTYSVTWRYNKMLVPAVDYTTSISGGSSYVNMLCNPVNNSLLSMDYTYYLSRIDLICLNTQGDIVVIEGQSNRQELVHAPITTDSELLTLGSVSINPNSSSVSISNNNNKRLTVDKLYEFVNRLESLEYNQALQDLEQKAMQGENITDLKGIFTDGFLNTQKADATHSQFNATLALDMGELIMPSVPTVKPLAINTSDVYYRSSKYDRLVTALSTESVMLQQTYSTQAMVINPYKVYSKGGVVKLTPSVDSWIDTSNISLDSSTSIQAKYLSYWDWYYKKYSNDTLDSISAKVLEGSTTFMRTIRIDVTGENFVADTDNLVGYFDGVQVDLTPSQSKYDGTQVGTLKADASGVVSGYFMIPSGVRTGTREFVLVNNSNSASNTFTANGIKRSVTSEVIHTKSSSVSYYPLAQSFIVPTNRIVNSVGLYFCQKDTVIPVTVQIRNMSNGYPGNVIFAEKVVYPSDITTSTDGSIETKISFTDPVSCNSGTEYCIVVGSDSDKYSVYIASIGSQDTISNQLVVKQPYDTGVLFSSSNALTWSSHQTDDLKFKLYGSTFDSNSTNTVTFLPISGSSFDQFLLCADAIVPAGTSCTWEYCLDGNSLAWYPITPNVMCMLGGTSTSIQFRCKMSSTNTISPIMSTDSLNVLLFATDSQCSYISKNTNLSSGFQTIKQIVDIYNPNGSTVKVQYATDTTGTTWEDATLLSSSQLDGTYTTYTFVSTLGASATNFRARILMTTTQSYIRPKCKNLMNILK